MKLWRPELLVSPQLITVEIGLVSVVVCGGSCPTSTYINWLWCSGGFLRRRQDNPSLRPECTEP